MSHTEKRLDQLGIALPRKDRRGKGAVPVREACGLLFVSAQLPCDENGVPLFTGKVGTDLSPEEGYQAARQCAVNTLAVLADYVGDLDRVDSVVKVLGLVNSGADFSSQPAVINGFSDLMLEVFGERGVHARSAMGAYTLPQGVPVVVESIFKLR